VGLGAGWDLATHAKPVPNPYLIEVLTQQECYNHIHVLYSCQSLKRNCKPHDRHPSSSPPMQSDPPGKWMLKMTKRAKAALEEQYENSKKHKKGNQTTEAVPKKVCSDPQTGNASNSSVPSSPVPAANKSHQPMVEDVDDEYDEFHPVGEAQQQHSPKATDQQSKTLMKMSRSKGGKAEQCRVWNLKVMMMS